MIDSRRRSASGSGCSSARPIGNTPRWQQGSRGLGSPGDEEADAAGSVIAAESAPCGVLVREGACWATAVAAAGAPAEPVPPSKGTGKTEAKAVSAAGKNAPRPGHRSTVMTAADTRAMNLPEGAERSSMLRRGTCAQKSCKSEEAKENPPKTRAVGAGHQPPKPTPGVRVERVRSPQTRMRKILPSSTGVRLLDPLRSCSVTGSGKRDRKSAFPLALPLRYSQGGAL